MGKTAEPWRPSDAQWERISHPLHRDPHYLEDRRYRHDRSRFEALLWLMWTGIPMKDLKKLGRSVPAVMTVYTRLWAWIGAGQFREMVRRYLNEMTPSVRRQWDRRVQWDPGPSHARPRVRGFARRKSHQHTVWYFVMREELDRLKGGHDT